MIAVEEVRSALPEAAKDIRLNLQSVLEGGALNDAQNWGVAAACAIAARNQRLRDAVLAGRPRPAGAPVVEDAKAAAVADGDEQRVLPLPAHGRQAGLLAEAGAAAHAADRAAASTNKVDFELFCLAVSAINGCEACVQAHEQVVARGRARARSTCTTRCASRRRSTPRRSRSRS